MTDGELTEIQIKTILEVALIKANGHKYEDVKKGLRNFYEMNKYRMNYPYSELESLFDSVWANTIQIVPKEELK